jgi:hypothetical protein
MQRGKRQIRNIGEQFSQIPTIFQALLSNAVGLFPISAYPHRVIFFCQEGNVS